MNGMGIIFLKELKDALRDRRALMVAMLPAVFGPLAMMLLLSTAAKTRTEARTETLTLSVIGQQNAPDLINYLTRHDIEIEDFEGDPKTEIQARNSKVVLSISKSFGEDFRAFRPATVELIADDSLEKSDQAADRVRRLLHQYSREIGALRLMVRGVDPGIASPLDIQNRDFSTRTSRAGQLLNTLQLILLMAAFFGGSGVAIDTTAGERERKSWVTLLVHPISSLSIIGGKWMTVALFALAASVVSVLATALATSMFSLEALGVDPRLTVAMMIGIVAIQIPMVMLASSVQMLVTLFAKSFKEAQAYLGILTLLPMLPVMITMFQDIKTETWMYLIPIAGQQQLLTSVMRGDGMPLDGYLIAAAVTTVVAVAVFAVLTKLLRSERVVFGG